MSLLDRGGWSRFYSLVRPFLLSDRRRRASVMMAALLALLLTISVLNVVSSFINRDVMTALAERRSDRFALMSVTWVGIFAVLSTVAAFYRFTEERLGLFWRKWMTAQLIDRYLADRRFYAVTASQAIDNPDQRISEDVRTFTVTTLSLLLILLNSTITFFAFIGVLWAITPWLVVGAVVYAAIGTGTTVLVGRRLVALNNSQYAVEANLRYDLARIREHAESLALYDGGQGIARRLVERLIEVVGNLRRIIGVNRNLNVAVNGFGYLTPVVPVLIVAPAYFRGEVEFGVVTQSAIAFAQVLGAFSLAITNFGQLSSLAAVVDRLAVLSDFLYPTPAAAAGTPDVVDQPDRWACEGLTLAGLGGRRSPLVDLTFENPRGKNVLVLGIKGLGTTELFAATAGLRVSGSGRIVRPTDSSFLPLRPYYPPGKLRELIDDFGTKPIPDDRIVDMLRQVGFGLSVDAAKVLDEHADWTMRLPPGDLQAVSMARLLLRPPAWAFMNGVVAAFSPAQREKNYQLLSDAKITYVTFTDEPDCARFHDRILHVEGGGRWWVEERT
jgi:putative ATP-binding cassette transporter